MSFDLFQVSRRLRHVHPKVLIICQSAAVASEYRWRSQIPQEQSHKVHATLIRVNLLPLSTWAEQSTSCDRLSRRSKRSMGKNWQVESYSCARTEKIVTSNSITKRTASMAHRLLDLPGGPDGPPQQQQRLLPMQQQQGRALNVQRLAKVLVCRLGQLVGMSAHS